MCEPTTIIMGISLGASLLGGLSAAEGQKAEGDAAAASGRFNRIAAQNAALVARQNAGRAGEIGAERVADLAEEGRFVTGRALTQLAANGVVVGDGSALDLTEDIAARTRRNVARTRQETVERQTGFIAQAGDLETRGLLDEAEGLNALRASRVRARTTLLNTGANVASSWYDYSKIGGKIT